jgi:hypothetical protein
MLNCILDASLNNPKVTLNSFKFDRNTSGVGNEVAAMNQLHVTERENCVHLI